MKLENRPLKFEPKNPSFLKVQKRILHALGGRLAEEEEEVKGCYLIFLDIKFPAATAWGNELKGFNTI